MTDISTLRDIVQDGMWLLDSDEDLTERDMEGVLLPRSGFEVAEVATGVRRSGKSKLLLEVGRKLKRSGKNVSYLNFEDDRFIPNEKDFQKLTDILDLRDAVLLVDEPQNMPKWEKWVRRMQDRGIKIFITGSNSSLLGSEFATALAGRKKEHEVSPFSFKEYLRARKIVRPPSDLRMKEFEEYLVYGGFPYPTISGDRSILSDYRRDIIERDIIMRHRIRNPSIFVDLVMFIYNNPGLYLSKKSVKNVLSISHVTLRKYLGYLEDAYAVLAIPKFGFSKKESLLNPKKIYPVDNGLLIKKDNKGRMLESCIVQHLRRFTKEIYYWKDERGREIDIYLPEKKIAIQVVYELNSENVTREERALESAVGSLKARPLMVYLHSDIETEYPMLRAPDVLDELESWF